MIMRRGQMFQSNLCTVNETVNIKTGATLYTTQTERKQTQYQTKHQGENTWQTEQAVTTKGGNNEDRRIRPIRLACKPSRHNFMLTRCSWNVTPLCNPELTLSDWLSYQNKRNERGRVKKINHLAGICPGYTKFRIIPIFLCVSERLRLTRLNCTISREVNSSCKKEGSERLS